MESDGRASNVEAFKDIENETFRSKDVVEIGKPPTVTSTQCDTQVS